MKIAEQTPTRLKICDRPLIPWVLGSILIMIGLIIFGVGLIVNWGDTLAFYALLVFAGLFWVTGLLVLDDQPTVVCTLDKTTGQVTLKRRTLSKSDITRCCLAEVIEVRLIPKVAQGPNINWINPSGFYSCRIILQLNSGGFIPLTPHYSDATRAQHYIVEQIARFLNL